MKSGNSGLVTTVQLKEDNFTNIGMIEEILRLNPHISEVQLKESLLLTKQLAKAGVRMSEYNLASPFSRRRIKEEEWK